MSKKEFRDAVMAELGVKETHNEIKPIVTCVNGGEPEIIGYDVCGVFTMRGEVAKTAEELVPYVYGADSVGDVIRFGIAVLKLHHESERVVYTDQEGVEQTYQITGHTRSRPFGLKSQKAS